MIMKTQNFVTMDYKDFQKLVNKFIPESGGKYDYVVSEELSNDSSQVYRNIKPGVKIYEPFGDNDLMYRAYDLLLQLRNMKVIPSGDYLIEVCW